MWHESFTVNLLSFMLVQGFCCSGMQPSIPCHEGMGRSRKQYFMSQMEEMFMHPCNSYLSPIKHAVRTGCLIYSSR